MAGAGSGKRNLSIVGSSLRLGNDGAAPVHRTAVMENWLVGEKADTLGGDAARQFRVLHPSEPL